jgi:putative methanogenesis marker protein 3
LLEKRNKLSEDIDVEVNGKRLAVPPGSRLADCLAMAGVRRVPGTIIGIIIGKAEARKEVATEFRVVTSKGEFGIELTGNQKDAWLRSYDRLVGSKLRWTTGHAVAFGPFASDVQPARGETELKTWDVSFGTGGYDAKSSYIIISKATHSSDYGASGKPFGWVISGKSVIPTLGNDDYIKFVEPVMRLETFANKIVTTDESLPAEDGMEIHTELEVELIPKAKDGAEHFYSAIKDSTFPVDFAASTFISSDVMLGELCPYENLAARSEGSVSVRTDGAGRGRIYISRKDMTSNIYHSIIGRTTNGLELARLASPGQRIAINARPLRLSVLGFNLGDAEAFLTERGIKYEKAGYQGDGAVVVEQEPYTTMEIVSAGQVKITGIPRKDLVEIRLYDGAARNSVEFFRRATGLKGQHVGALDVFFKYEDTMLFKGKPVHVLELVPENKPEEGAIIGAGEIGLTNMAAKHAGMLGVRFSDSPKFGPTGEKFTATNIVGKVLDIAKLKQAKEKGRVYFTEVP